MPLVDYWLYGVKVTCPFALFDHEVPTTAIAPGAHAALTLRAAPDEPARGTESSRLYATHGRELWIHTDRPMALSTSGQPWCFEVLRAMGRSV